MSYPFQFGGFDKPNNRTVIGIGGWKELGRIDTTGGASATIDLTGLADKRYLMVLSDLGYTAALVPYLRLNSVSTGTPYADRYSSNGGADATTVSQNQILYSNSSSTRSFGVGYISNKSANEKLFYGHTVNQSTAGAGTAPSRYELAAKHANTASVVSAVNLATSTSTFTNTSELVVLEWDPTDIHLTNFWTEIGSGTASGSSDTLDITLSSTYKYIWFQGFTGAGSTSDISIRFGSGSLDSGANYALRRSDSGGADATSTSQTGLLLGNTGTTDRVYFNGFMINNASNEKIGVMWRVRGLTTPSAGTAPARSEYAIKWANTSNQANHIGLFEATGNLPSVTTMKVWGAN